MKPAEGNRFEFFIDETIEYEAEIKYKKAPDAVEAQCSNCAEPQSAETELETRDGLEIPEDEVKQEETPVAAEAPQCPGCAKLQPEEKLELQCACSPQKAVENGNSAMPEQVLAQYNSRPPVLVNTNGRRPFNAAAKPTNTQPGRPVYAAPRLCNCRQFGR